MGIMNIYCHENISLRNTSYCKLKKKAEASLKPLKCMKCLNSWQTQHLNIPKKGFAGLTSLKELKNRTVNSLLKTDVQVQS